MHRIYFISLLSILLPSLLNGCSESEGDINQICQTSAALCEKLNMGDGQCIAERTKLIQAKFASKQDSSDLNKFDELLITKEYATCMELAAQIEVVTLKERKNQRTEALYHAYDSIKQLKAQLNTSYHPTIIYYRWTQGDKDALDQFLKLEETQYLNTPALQLGLVSYYADKDKEHTINILHKALGYYDGKDKKTKKEILPEIIKTLATTNHALGKQEHAYFWTLIGDQFNLPIANKDKLNRLYTLTKERQKEIINLANSVSNNIKEGQFHTDLISSLQNTNLNNDQSKTQK